ncbi:MAG TPA: M14 family zinc carboxypeptidase [Tenuifilaceae bacterium]|nr:M14 family zinc carboxypeptidase [Tenuifilaceae bacterium]
MKSFKFNVIALCFLFFTAFASFTSFSQSSKLSEAQSVLAERNELYFSFNVDNKDILNEFTNVVSIDNYNHKTGEVFAYANSTEFNEFLKFGIDYNVLLAPSLQQDKALTMATTIADMANWDRYPTYETYREMMKKFEQDYPAICKLDSIGTSIEGRKIYVIKISDNVLIDEAEPEFFYTSTMHGDEATGYVLMLRLIDYFLSNYGSDTRVDNMVNNLAIYINPNANPDGTYNYGNHTVSGSTRSNANGVDINRDFPDPRIGANSPYTTETQVFMNYAESRNFVFSANFHGGIELANFPWDAWTTSQNAHADHNWFYDVSRQYADLAQANSPAGYFTGLNNGVTQGGDWYVVAGGRQDYMNYWHHCKEITFEISDTKLISSDQLPAHWTYNKEAMLTYIEHLFTGIQGTVTNSEGDPLDATITVENHDKDNSHVVTNPNHGNYIRMIEDGTWDLTFAADGYASQTIEDVVVTDGGPVQLNVVLYPNSEFPAPTGLQSDVENIRDVALTWNQPSYSGSLVLENYKIYRNDNLLTQTSSTSYTDEDLAVGSYSYNVTAVYSNPAGESNPSNTVTESISFFTITATDGENGSISPSGSVLVSQGNSQTFSFTPNSTYEVSTVLVDGSSVGNTSSYQFTNVTSNHTIHVDFSKIEYTIGATPNNESYGSVTGAGSYEHGETVSLTATPAQYYHFVRWTEDDVQVSTNPTISFTATENRTLVAVFDIEVFTISAAPNNPNFGEVTGAGDYSNGETVTLEATPNTHYHFVNWTESAIEVSANSTYSFTTEQDRSLVANFANDTYTITASTVGNGSISPSGEIVVNYNEDLTFTITPDGGNYIQNVKVDGVSVGSVNTYTFTNVAANHSIVATFTDVEPTYYTVAITTNGNGTVTPSGDVSVAEGNDLTLSIIPNNHYHISDVFLNSESVLDDVVISSSGNGTLALTNISASSSVEVQFDIDTYIITATASENGTISPSGEVVCEHGASQQFTFMASENYHISNVLVDGESVGVVSSYTFQDVSSSHTIEVFFEANTFVISASAGNLGIISPSGNVVVNQGSSKTFTISPNSGANIVDVQVDGESVGAVRSYTFDNIQENHTIVVTFELSTYTITASAELNGTISPEGDVVVNHGASQTFTFTPSENYKVLDVLVDGESVGARSSYTFANVTANHQISVRFTLQTFNIFASTTGNGAISPSGNVEVEYEADQLFEIVPNEGYHVYDVTVNGESVGAVSEYTFESVTANGTIQATFEINSYTITATAGENGTISPVGETVVNHGDDLTYTISPSNEYHVEDVLVNGESVGSVTTYKFSSIGGNATIHADFSINTYILSITKNGEGRVTVDGVDYSGPLSFSSGTSVELVAIPDTDWEFDGWANGITSTQNPVTINFLNDYQITAVFSSTVGLNTGELANVNVFPNPFSNFVNVANASEVERIFIVALTGEVVFEGTANGSAEIEIGTSNLAPGVYFVNLEARTGLTKVVKLVKVK